MKLKRKGPGSYITTDGNFEVYRLHGIACAKWQIRTTDGSQPFKYTLFGKQRVSNVSNEDSFNDCREVLTDIYERHPEYNTPDRVFYRNQ